MSIKELSKTTQRRLGSHAVITTPVDLVRELIDNSLDANATSIDILVSHNTVDKIEVSDNGRGIHPDDYEFLGKRGHTSKITTFGDVQSIGGSSLGFRGEALASASALGKLTLTTRTSYEPEAGTQIRLKSGGGVVKQKSIHAPEGTCVTIEDLFSGLPVRKPLAIKDAPKAITRITGLVQAYALARPRVRYSFKVLKDSKPSLHYSPRQNEGIREAVIQLFGTGLASQCVVRTYPAVQDQSRRDASAETSTADQQATDQFSLEAVLPKPDCDPAKLGAKGSFISVDGRPISSSKGIGKAITAIFRSHLKKILELSGSTGKPKDPFIRLDIRCPAGSYDPNVETSKNEVLFADEKEVINLFEGFCSDFYTGSTAGYDTVASDESRLDYNSDSLGCWRELEGSCDPPIALEAGPKYSVLEFDLDLHGVDRKKDTKSDQMSKVDPKFRIQSSGDESSTEIEAQLSPCPSGPARGLRDGAADTTWRVDLSRQANTESKSDVEDEKHRQALGTSHAKPLDHRPEGLNLWAIAKLHSSGSHDHKPSHDGAIRSRAALSQELDPEESFGEPIVLRRPVGGPPRDLDASPGRGGLGMPRSANGLVSVPGGTYRSPMRNGTGAIAKPRPKRALRQPGARGRDQSGPQTHPCSSPARGELRRPQLGVPHSWSRGIEPNGMVQSTISFGGNAKGNNTRQGESGEERPRQSVAGPLFVDINSGRAIRSLMSAPEHGRRKGLRQRTLGEMPFSCGRRLLAADDLDHIFTPSRRPGHGQVPPDDEADTGRQELQGEKLYVEPVELDWDLLPIALEKIVDVDTYVHSGALALDKEGLDPFMDVDQALELERHLKQLLVSLWGSTGQTYDIHIGIGLRLKERASRLENGNDGTGF